MSSNTAAGWPSYIVPVFAAVAVHALLFYVFAGGLQFSDNRRPEVSKALPVVKASLVTLKKPKAVKKAVKKKVVKKKPAAKKVQPIVEIQKQPEPVAKAEEKTADKPAKKEPTNSELLDELFADEDQALELEEEQLAVASYSAAMAQAIENHWSRPPSARNNMQALLVINLVPTGDVVSVNVKSGSGNAAFDRAAILAVEKIGRFDFLQGMPSRLFEAHFRQIEIVFKPEDLRL